MIKAIVFTEIGFFCKLVGKKCRFGQLQQVDVNSVEPAIRAGLNSLHNNFIVFDPYSIFWKKKTLVEMEGGSLREDAPETFENRFDLS